MMNNSLLKIKTIESLYAINMINSYLIKKGKECRLILGILILHNSSSTYQSIFQLRLIPRSGRYKMTSELKQR